ncbi:hypothetical protein [Bifidobacterium sp. ESL0820]|uniref:hypothetical protein n=1 Tax=Bifidobacterium sp. ESL0820 TaxID=3448586 RepID=UPI00404184F8
MDVQWVIGMVAVPVFASIIGAVIPIIHGKREVPNSEIEPQDKTSEEQATTEEVTEPRSADWRIFADDTHKRFVLANIGDGDAHDVTVMAKLGSWSEKWPQEMAVRAFICSGGNDSLLAYDFFSNRLPELREEGQQGGETFLDGHTEGGDGMAHAHADFFVTWVGDDSRTHNKNITIDIN